MFRVLTTPIIRSTQNCNYSLPYWSYFLCSHSPPTWPSFPSSVHKTVTTASRTGHIFCAATSLQRGQAFHHQEYTKLQPQPPVLVIFFVQPPPSNVAKFPIIRSTQNCNYSLPYWSYFLCSHLPPMWPS